MSGLIISHKQKWLKLFQILAIFLTTLLLVATISFLIIESTWVKQDFKNPQEAFNHGSIGTELMPLPVLQVLPDMFPEQFQPAGKQIGDWIEQFGFIKSKPGENAGLPVGFNLSNYRPKSGSPSPIKFVGFSCTVCHTSTIKRSQNDYGFLVEGMGNTSLNFLAWVDAVKTVLLDEQRLNLQSISAAYEAKYQKPLKVTDKAMIALWLSSTRQTLKDTLPKTDLPYNGKDLRNSELIPTGPIRTQPFRNLVRIVMNRPAMSDKAYSKLPTVYEQKNREWAQFDGSVKNPITRSTLAALSAGATVENLALPEISHNIVQAAKYTSTLKGPAYLEVFPDQDVTRDAEKVERGQIVYMQNCSTCHGYRNSEDNKWIKGQLQGEISTLEKIKTDAERVNFRYYDVVTDYLYDYFPKKHPLKPNREDLRPGPLGNTKGYINTPLESVFTRAPYLHNGSILTLAELINLKPRREIFYRGNNLYDPVDVGLISPDQPDDQNYFKFDTRVKGNSNQGHDYPWSYQGEGWNQAALEDLLEFLKTL